MPASFRPPVRNPKLCPTTWFRCRACLVPRYINARSGPQRAAPACAFPSQTSRPRSGESILLGTETRGTAGLQLFAAAAAAHTLPAHPCLRPLPLGSEQLKALGFRCHHEERYWELGPRQFSVEKEQLLRTLLESGELPAGSPSSPAITPTKRRANGAAAFGAGAGGPRCFGFVTARSLADLVGFVVF